jgi:hypothetical protein
LGPFHLLPPLGRDHRLSVGAHDAFKRTPLGHGPMADDYVVFPGILYTALRDGGKIFSRVADEPPIRCGQHAGPNVVSRDAYDTPLYLFILAWEGRT